MYTHLKRVARGVLSKVRNNRPDLAYTDVIWLVCQATTHWRRMKNVREKGDGGTEVIRNESFNVLVSCSELTVSFSVRIRADFKLIMDKSCSN